MAVINERGSRGEIKKRVIGDELVLMDEFPVVGEVQDQQSAKADNTQSAGPKIKTQGFDAAFEAALMQRTETAVIRALTPDVVLTAELIVAGIERGTVNGRAADSFLIAHGLHTPAGDTTVAGASMPFLRRQDAQGSRVHQTSAKDFDPSRKTPPEREAIVTYARLQRRVRDRDLGHN